MRDPYLSRLKQGWARPDVGLSEQDAKIASLWKRRFNTVEIGAFLHVPESKIANDLARLRDAGAL